MKVLKKQSASTGSIKADVLVDGIRQNPSTLTEKRHAENSNQEPTPVASSLFMPTNPSQKALKDGSNRVTEMKLNEISILDEE